MPRPRKEVPAYRNHRPRNQGRVVVADQTVYFPGPYNSPESLAAYRRWLADYLATGQVHPEQPSPTVGELVLAYSDQVIKPRFCPDGKETGESRSYQIALRALTRLAVDLPVDDFTPRDLIQVRAAMVEAGYTRKRINQHVQRIRRMFKWGVTQGTVPVAIWQALTAIEGLRYGEAKRESAKVSPVSEAHVEAIRPHVTPPIWVAVETQLWTGARPGEILQMRTCDVHTDDPWLPAAVRGLCWVYRPPRHKSQRHDKPRLILIGPHAKALIEPWLRPDAPTAYLFDPREAMAWFSRERRAKAKRPRKGPVKAFGGPKHDHYDVPSYRHAIRRACLRAGIPIWHPHQLRHTAATRIRAAYGIEVARIILGHTNIATTEIYAEADLAKAAEAVAALG